LPVPPGKDPFLTVSPSKQIFHCFGCGAGGDVLGFLIRHGNYTFPEAVRRLADRAGIEIPEVEPGKGRGREDYDIILKANEGALEYFTSSLESKSGAKARKYLVDRDMAEAVKEFDIGYSLPGWDGLLGHLRKMDIKPEAAEKAGLAIKKADGRGYYDRFRDRVMFPIRDVRGRCIGFGGRTMGDETPKYLNSPETALFRKGETLYGIDIASQWIRKKDYSVIVEGYFDAIACHRAGVTNAVATMGTALTAGHLRLLGRFSRNVMLVFDSDPAGIKAAERSLDVFLGTKMVPKVALLPQGDDPDSLYRREGAAGVRKALAKSVKLMDFVIKRASKDAKDIEEKKEAAAKLTGILARVENGVERDYYLKLSAAELSVDEAALREELDKKLSKGGRLTGAYTSDRRQPASLNKIEEGLLNIILNEPALAAEIADSLSLDDFSDQRIREIAAKAFEIIKETGGLKIPGLIDSLDNPEEKSLVLSVSMKEPVDDPKGYAEGAAGRLRQAAHSRKGEELQRRIRQAEESKDFGLLNKLTKELFEWQKKKS